MVIRLRSFLGSDQRLEHELFAQDVATKSLGKASHELSVGLLAWRAVSSLQPVQGLQDALAGMSVAPMFGPQALDSAWGKRRCDRPVEAHKQAALFQLMRVLQKRLHGIGSSSPVLRGNL